MKWGTNEMAALGSWMGALATFTAAMVSLRIAKTSSKPKIRTTATYGYFTYEQKPYIGEAKIIITGTNEGVLPVTLVSSGLVFPKRLFKKKKTAHFKESSEAVPRKLEPSDNTFYAIDPKQLAKTLRDNGYNGKYWLKFHFGDTLDNRYVGKLKFNVREWEK